MNFSKIERRVGKLVFGNPLVYGGGTLKTLQDVEAMCLSAAAGGEIGSISPKSKAGNEGKTFYAHYQNGVLIYTLNSLGLPNPGKDYWTLHAAEALRRAHDAGKLLGINIVGDTVQEIVEMLIWALDLGFDWVTINAGCPNKWDLKDGNPIPQGILSFDSGDTERLMEQLETYILTDTEIWWKPSPDNDTLGSAVKNAQIVAQSNVITAWIANNTVPHCFAWDNTGGATISPGGGLAGMGGPAVKPKALGDIHRLRKILPKNMHIIGTGGVTYGQDIHDFLKSEADLVQFTSAFWANNMDNNTSGRMLEEYCELPEVQKILA